MDWFSAILAFFKALLGIKPKDPEKVGLKEAFNAKENEAKVMEAPDRIESSVDDQLLAHARKQPGNP